MLVPVLATLLAIQLMFWEGSGGRPKCLGSCARMADLEEAPDLGLSALAIGDHLGSEPASENLFFSLLFLILTFK